MMKPKLKYIVSILIGIVPLHAWMIRYRLVQEENFTTQDMLIYPLLFGGGSILLMLALNHWLINKTFKQTFNPGKGTFINDLIIGFALTLIYFLLFMVGRNTLYQWFPNPAPNTEILNTIRDLARSPLLLLIWFIPVLWIGIALFEEMVRTFLLTCLWSLNASTNWAIFTIFLTSALIGVLHLYQGTAGIISIGIQSLIACFYFYKSRRLLPLVISHGLYDGLQLGFLIVQLR